MFGGLGDGGGGEDEVAVSGAVEVAVLGVVLAPSRRV